MDVTDSQSYPLTETFTRQRVQILTSVPDDVLGFWIKQELLIPLPAAPRAHRRFRYEQINIAAVLNTLRSLGANIAVLRSFSEPMQRGVKLSLDSGLTHGQLFRGLELAKVLCCFRRGEACQVFNRPWIPRNQEEVDYARSESIATNEMGIELSWLFRERNEEDVEPAIDFMRQLSEEDIRCLGFFLEIANPEYVSDNNPTMNWTWIAWVDENGTATFLSGENAHVAQNGHLPTAAFFISISRIIRKLWVPLNPTGDANMSR